MCDTCAFRPHLRAEMVGARAVGRGQIPFLYINDRCKYIEHNHVIPRNREIHASTNAK